MQNVIGFAMTSGLTPGGSLRPQRMFEVDSRGVRFLAPTQGQGAMTFEHYTELLQGWKTIRETWDIGLADILAYGVARFGQEQVDGLMGQLEFDLADKLRAYAIGQIPLDLRTDELTSEHLYALGRIEDKGERGKWMALAGKHQLTAVELKKSIIAGEVIRQADLTAQQGGSSGLNTIQGVRHWFEDWERKMGGEQKIFALPTESLRQLLEELRGPGELYCKVKARLEAEPVSSGGES